MASNFFMSPIKIKTFGGKEVSVPFYMQFVPGYCIEVVHSPDSSYYKAPNHINTIIAVPHHTSEFYKTRNSTSDDNRYYPLFRTTHDVPTKGDPVLLCNVGGINYYMGPLNMDTNSPTWNDNQFLKEELSTNAPFNQGATRKSLTGESPTFNKNVKWNRLSKYSSYMDKNLGKTINETTGDFLIEGRHGNSIRIGSRDQSPYVFLSNNRFHRNTLESLTDGSLITITSVGSLQRHFERYKKEIVNTNDGSVIETIKYGFTLGSDDTDPGDEYLPKNFMGQMVANVNSPERNIDKSGLYDYETDQILFHSDRITINTKLNDIYISSKKDVHIGARRHLTISTSEDFIIQSDRFFLGDPFNQKMQGMVLGNTLLEMLKEILSVMKSAQGICQGAPIPLADETGSPGGVNQKITQIEQRIEEILSNKHMIASNE